MRNTNHVLDTVTARTALTLTGTCGSVPAKSTAISSPSIVTVARMVAGCVELQRVAEDHVPSGIAATAARTRRSL